MDKAAKSCQFILENPGANSLDTVKRKRCDNCTQSKKGCDRSDTCDRCRTRHKECVYSDKRRRKNKETQSNIDSINETLDESSQLFTPSSETRSFLDGLESPINFSQEAYSPNASSCDEDERICHAENPENVTRWDNQKYSSPLTFSGIKKDIARGFGTPKLPFAISQLKSYWSWCTKAKNSLPDGTRQENMTWRMMGMMRVKQRKQMEYPPQYPALFCDKAQSKDENSESNDPLKNIWRLYTTAKDLLPNGSRSENLVWRIMAAKRSKQSSQQFQQSQQSCSSYHSMSRWLTEIFPSIAIPVNNEDDYREREWKRLKKEAHESERRSFYAPSVLK